MSKIALTPNASGTGVVTIASPNTNTDRTLTLPDATGTVNISGLANEVPAGSAGAPSIFPTGDTNTGLFFPAADTVAVATGGSERLRVDASGNLGIGTPSPATKLDVNGSVLSTGLTTDGTGAAGFDVQSNRANSGQARASFYVFGPNNTTSYQALRANYAGIYSAHADIALNADTSKTIQFWTGGTERARIDASGNLLVGTTSTYGPGRVNVAFNGASSAGVSVYNSNAGNTGGFSAFFNSGGTQIGAINQNGSSAVSYATSSDYRLKENVAPMQNALDTVAQLNPVTYTWKADGSAGQGFIAHELQAVVPDCVTGEKDAVDAEGNPQYQGVDTSFLVATLVKAIQEQQAMIQALQAEVAALKGASA